MFKPILIFFFLTFTLYNATWARDRTLISSKNEFGGKTYQSDLEKRTLVFFEYYDVNGVKIVDEYLYTEDYPILTPLVKRRIHYKLSKVIKEEHYFSPKYIHQKMIKKTILYFDPYSGKKTAAENHFSKSYLGYNTVFFKEGKREKIEWYYPKNKEGISKKIFFYNEKGKETRSTVYFTHSFIKENGYYKKSIIKGHDSGSYLRKKEEIWYYTDNFAEQNSDLVRKVVKYSYHPNHQVDTRTYYFDSLNEELIYSQQ